MLSDYPPIDKEDLLSKEDLLPLKKKFKREMHGWLVAGIVISLFVIVLDFPLTIYHWGLGLVVWIGSAVAKILRHRYVLEGGKKRVIRGFIAQRYKTENDESLDLVIFINGKRLAVPADVYQKYFTGDFVEFHFHETVVLQHKLLKRGKKVYV
jgi:hypothetical protein